MDPGRFLEQATRVIMLTIMGVVAIGVTIGIVLLVVDTLPV